MHVRILLGLIILAAFVPSSVSSHVGRGHWQNNNNENALYDCHDCPAPITGKTYTKAQFLEQMTKGIVTSKPEIGVSPDRLEAGAATVTITVAGGPGTPTDWVDIIPTGSSGDVFSPDWRYLNGTQSPTTGKTAAIVTFPAPKTGGTYVARFYRSDSFQQLAESGIVTVTATKPPSNSVLDLYWSDAVRFGTRFKTQFLTDHKGSNYYDTCWAFAQVGMHTKDASWDDAAHYSCLWYREQEIQWLPEPGGAAGYNTFPHGLKWHYQRNPTGNARSKEALKNMATHSWADPNGMDGGSYLLAREVAYAIQAILAYRSVGGTTDQKRLDALVGWAIKHHEAWFITKEAILKPHLEANGQTGGLTPFQVGLWGHALWEYYQATQDARIKPLFASAAEGLMTMNFQTVAPNDSQLPTWKPDHGGFCYDTSRSWGKCVSPVYPGLSPLILPVFLAAHATTGDSKYLAYGDLVFREAVIRNHCSSIDLNELPTDPWCKGSAMNGDDLGYGGKSWTQAYRSSEDWANYRTP